MFFCFTSNSIFHFKIHIYNLDFFIKQNAPLDFYASIAYECFLGTFRTI
ncbi:hypothetical protein MHIR_DE00449 [Candidatus Doolittlea endobia]|uniref:Uncharacterized protein n=1 Tax=Candidatus Doolittlea endobia TaxID=1778262 RepID=A0A143WSL8_9ENTR|nr:hypothetical protein MHIR_DE00449 [Candidatus Doolittlea endobia]